jgi:glucan phosphorylase
MDKRIIKVIYDNGEEKVVGDYKSKEQIKQDKPIGEKEDWRVNRTYNRQFKDFEREILWELDDDMVKDYAKDHLDLKDENENDCDCQDKDVSDFEDEELMAELSRRNLLGYANVNIISIDLFTRFSRVITKADNQELETIISELEKKYNL